MGPGNEAKLIEYTGRNWLNILEAHRAGAKIICMRMRLIINLTLEWLRDLNAVACQGSF